jgi:hypothetical protein
VVHPKASREIGERSLRCPVLEALPNRSAGCLQVGGACWQGAAAPEDSPGAVEFQWIAEELTIRHRSDGGVERGMGADERHVCAAVRADEA